MLSKPCGLGLAFLSNHNTFGIVANMDKGRAEARLAVELVAVQLDERPGELDRQIRAERGINDGDDEEQRTDRPQHSGKGKDREGAVDRHERERKRGGGERACVLGDPLVWICEFAGHRQAIVGSIGHIGGDGALGHEFPPKQAEPLSAKRAERLRSWTREDRKRRLSLPNECRGVPFRDGGHQVSIDETVCDIKAVRRHEKHEDGGERQFRSPADLRPREGSDGRDERVATLALGVPWACMPRLGEWATN